MTREEAKAILENDIVDGHVEGTARFMEAFWVAVDALSQESILDKIRAEIEQEYTKFRNKSDMWNERACGLGTALEIIDKYKAEGSDKE